jgi:hypothetical protein
MSRGTASKGCAANRKILERRATTIKGCDANRKILERRDPTIKCIAQTPSPKAIICSTAIAKSGKN